MKFGFLDGKEGGVRAGAGGAEDVAAMRDETGRGGGFGGAALPDGVRDAAAFRGGTEGGDGADRLGNVGGARVGGPAEDGRAGGDGALRKLSVNAAFLLICGGGAGAFRGGACGGAGDGIGLLSVLPSRPGGNGGAAGAEAAGTGLEGGAGGGGGADTDGDGRLGGGGGAGVDLLGGAGGVGAPLVACSRFGIDGGLASPDIGFAEVKDQSLVSDRYRTWQTNLSYWR